MESCKLVILVALFATLSVSIAAADVDDRHSELQTPPMESGLQSLAGDGGSPFLGRRAARTLSQYGPRPSFTCDNYPGICRGWGSDGPNCCWKRCVDTSRDMLNCGGCGRRCRYGEACCGGSCVNVIYDVRNCGACGHKCKKGRHCLYGMCSYA